MQNAIIDTLLLLGYEKYRMITDLSGRTAKGAKDTGDLKQLFIKPTEPVMSSVVHFLLGRLDSRRATSAFRTLFPPKTPVQARDFRQAAVSWLQELEGSGVFPENTASVSVFISPSPTKITRFLWALSSHVFRVVAEREAGIKDHGRTQGSAESFMAQAVARAELFTHKRNGAEIKEREALKALSLLEKRLSELANERDELLRRDKSNDDSELSVLDEQSELSKETREIRIKTDELLSLLKGQKDFVVSEDTLGGLQEGTDVNSVLDEFGDKFFGLENDPGWGRLADSITFRGGIEHLVSRSVDREAVLHEKLCTTSTSAETVTKEIDSLSKSALELKAEVEAKALRGPAVGQELPSNRETRALVLGAVDEVRIVVPGKGGAAPSTPSKRRRTVVATTTPSTVTQNRKRAARRMSLIVNKLQKKRNSSVFVLNFDDDDNEDNDDSELNPTKSKGNL